MAGVGQTIGKQLHNGYPGGYAIQPDQLTGTACNVSGKFIAFGDLLLYKEESGAITGVETPTATFTMDKVAGIAAREVKQANEYLNQINGGYYENEAVTVFKRGIISVVCNDNEAKFGGQVYYRFNTDDATNKPIGFVSKEETGKTVKLEGYNFAGSIDSRGVVAVVIKEKINA